jgi:hypothetical protein
MGGSSGAGRLWPVRQVVTQIRDLEEQIAVDLLSAVAGQ